MNHGDTKAQRFTKKIAKRKEGEEVKEDCGATLAMIEPRRHKGTEVHEEDC